MNEDKLLDRAKELMENGEIRHISSMSFNPPTHYLHIPFTSYEWESLQIFLKSNNEGIDQQLLTEWLKGLIEITIENKTIYGTEVIKMGLKEIGVKVE